MFKNKFFWIIIAIVAVLFFWVKGAYNEMVTLDEGVNTAWSQVENQYQRRMDLIPNLVNTVKGYAAHEKETLEGVVNARAEATKTTIDPSNLNEETLKRFQAAQGELSSALSRLMVVIRNLRRTRTSLSFRRSWKGQKTVFPSSASVLTRSPKAIIPISVNSPIISCRVCLDSRRKLTFLRSLVRRRLLLLSFNK